MGPNLESCALTRGKCAYVAALISQALIDRLQIIERYNHRTKRCCVLSQDDGTSSSVASCGRCRLLDTRSHDEQVPASIAQRLQQQPPNSFCWGMRCCGKDDRSEGLFKQNPVGRPYPADHTLRMSTQLVDAALAELSRAFAQLYARDGRPSIPPGRLPNGYIYRVVVAWL